MTEFFIQENGEISGPFSLYQMQEKSINHDTLLSKNHDGPFYVASSYEELNISKPPIKAKTTSVIKPADIFPKIGVGVFVLLIITIVAYPLYKKFQAATNEENIEHPVAQNYVSLNNQPNTVVSTTPTQRKQTYYLREEARNNDFSVTVDAVTTVEPDEVIFDASGNTTYLSVKIVYRNYSSSEVYSSNPLDWKLVDDDGVAHSYDWTSKKSPELSSRDIHGLDSVVGWIVFRLQNNKRGVRLQYSGLYLEGPIEIKL